ncbi:ArsR/SmtB family transcription factor [Actinomadura sp. ATCC 39365]
MSRCAGDDTVELEGRGLVLTPSVFTWPDVLVDRSPLEAGWLVYPAGGEGRLWDDTQSAPECLTAVLGRTRASEPLSTGDLASRLAVTPGAVSQHLTALRATGLVTTRRAGRTATHTCTDLATGLIAASPSTAPLRP